MQVRLDPKEIEQYRGFVHMLSSIQVSYYKNEILQYSRKAKNVSPSIVLEGISEGKLPIEMASSIYGLEASDLTEIFKRSTETYSDEEERHIAEMIWLGKLSIIKRLKVAETLNQECWNGLVCDLAFWLKHPEVVAKCSSEEIREVNVEIVRSMRRLDKKREADLGSLTIRVVTEKKIHHNPYEEALEMHATALKFAKIALDHFGVLNGATVPFVKRALESAKTYCWSKDIVEAVATGARKLGPETKIVVEDLGLLGRPGASGFFWFTEAIPIKTTSNPPQNEPVCALVWMRDKALPTTYFTVMTMAGTLAQNGRMELLPTSTISWSWLDDMSLEELEKRSIEVHSAIKDKAGISQASMEEVAAAEQWFSRFFLVAAEWLQQRIVTDSPGHVERHARKRIAKELGNKEASVTVISLRRRSQVVSKEETLTDINGDVAERKKIDWSCKWYVDPFPRNQWYPSLKIHRRIWIDGFWKGPDDKPVKDKARVYAVVR